MRLRAHLHNLLLKVTRLPFIKLFAYFFVEICGGYRIYVSINKRHKGETIIFCPHTGTGDIYNIGLYFHQFLEKNHIEQYTFVFRGKSEKKIGALFDIEGDTILSDREILRLTRFIQFVTPEYVDVIQLHHFPYVPQAHMNLENFEDYKGITFNTMFRAVSMNLDSSTQPRAPKFEVPEDLETVFSEKGLIPGKTVVLSPYSSSAQIITFDKWEKIAEELMSAGYSVATNCVPKKEHPIAGTKELAFEYKYAKAYVEYAGYFVGARSGLCDIISSTNCKKIVLTPYFSPNLAWMGSPGKTMRFYGLFPNYANLNTAEIEYDSDSVELIPDLVAKLLEDPEAWTQEIRLRQSLAPVFGTKIAICIIFDEYFAPFASVTLQSIIEHASSSNTYDIFLFNDGLDKRTKRMLLVPFQGLDNFSVRFVDYTPLLAKENFHVERGYPPIVYSKITLPSVLNEFDKVIYLDADLILNTDIAEFYQFDMGKNLIAAVRDLPMIAWGSEPDNPEYKNIRQDLKLSDPYGYINAGVLIFNVKSFNSKLPLKKIIDFANSRNLRWMEQDIFNKLCDGNIFYLPQEYNVLTLLRNDSEIIRNSNCPELIFEYSRAMENPKVIHYIGRSFLFIDNPPYWLERYWRLARKTPYYELLQFRAVERIHSPGIGLLGRIRRFFARK